jgi:hypothetical protein
VFTITEIQTRYTVKHNTLMLYNNVLNISVYQNLQIFFNLLY